MTIRDGNWELLDWDVVTKRSTWVFFDGDKTHIRHDYPVEESLKLNKELFNTVSDNWNADYHHVASIPLNIFHDPNVGLSTAVDEGDDKYMSNWLNDSDNSLFRTKGGRV